MSNTWEKIETEVDTVTWKGESIHLTNIPAIRNVNTGKIRVDPADVAKAELIDMATRNDLEPRDIDILLMLHAKPGIFNGGEVHYRYHINKMLFYQWKQMSEEGLGEAFPRDEFEPARRGPIPMSINDDLKRLSDKGLVNLEYVRWGRGKKAESMKITLTAKGVKIAERLWFNIPEPLQQVTLKVKEMIFPLSPDTVKAKVHREYPEYRSTYTDEDTD